MSNTAHHRSQVVQVLHEFQFTFEPDKVLEVIKSVH